MLTKRVGAGSLVLVGAAWCSTALVRWANIRLTDWYMTINDISPKHIPDQCVSAPIKLRTKVALMRACRVRLGRIQKYAE
jgi:hypothetical protein